jgi:hypothetical protein
MDLGDQFDLEHLLFKTRQCRSCGKTKDVLTDFYRIRKDRKSLSAYSYECKECTKKRVSNARKTVVDKMVTNIFGRWEYPDW